MRVKFLYFILIITTALAVAAQTPTPSVDGNGLATLVVSGSNIRLVLKIEKSARGYVAKFDSPDQAVADWILSRTIQKTP